MSAIPGQPPGETPPLVRGVLRERSPAAVLILTVVTCGVYYFYWAYRTTEELRLATGDEDMKPGLELLLNIVTCTLFGLYVEYRNAERIHKALLPFDPVHQDKSQMVMILNVVMIVGAWLGGLTGICGLIAMYVVQDELNRLARATSA